MNPMRPSSTASGEPERRLAAGPRISSIRRQRFEVELGAEHLDGRRVRRVERLILLRAPRHLEVHQPQEVEARVMRARLSCTHG